MRTRPSRHIFTPTMSTSPLPPADSESNVVPPHHGSDGRFRNPWPDSAPHGFGDLLRWWRERRQTGRAPTPPRGSFPTATPRIVHPRATSDVARATWMGHSTVLLQVGGLNILIDPVWSERVSPVQWAGPRRVMPPPIPLEALPPLDVVLLSHSHYDHMDKPSIRWLARNHPEAHWVAPLRLGRYLRAFGVREVTELDWWQRAEVRGISVTGTPARHFSARRMGDRNRTLWCGYALEIAGRRVYFAGDTAFHPEFRAVGERCGPFDLALVPIGAYDPRWFMHVVHVDAEEAVQLYEDLVSPHPGAPLPLMLGLHWGTFRLTDEPMEEPPRRARARWLERGLPEGKLWVARFGETRDW
jgi:N-acyl-phosphatidylethanolamine-hydrolysing phospholipase D